MYYLFELNPTSYQWLLNFYKDNAIPKVRPPPPPPNTPHPLVAACCPGGCPASATDATAAGQHIRAIVRLGPAARTGELGGGPRRD